MAQTLALAFESWFHPDTAFSVFHMKRTVFVLIFEFVYSVVLAESA